MHHDPSQPPEDPCADQQTERDRGAQVREAQEEAGHMSTAQNFIETAAGAYFDACRRIARAISHIKRHHKKR